MDIQWLCTLFVDARRTTETALSFATFAFNTWQCVFVAAIDFSTMSLNALILVLAAGNVTSQARVVLQSPEILRVRDPDYATRGIPSGTGPVTVP
jgi:hypothetical protein